MTAGAVSNVTVTAGGTGYTWSKVFVIPGTMGGVAKAVLAPARGHGSDCASELGASTILISASLTSAFGNYIESDTNSIDGSFRQVSLLGNVRSPDAKNAMAYIGPTHSKWNAPDGLNRYEEGSGQVLYVNNIEAVVHTAFQEEIVKISITI